MRKRRLSHQPIGPAGAEFGDDGGCTLFMMSNRPGMLGNTHIPYEKSKPDKDMAPSKNVFGGALLDVTETPYLQPQGDGLQSIVSAESDSSWIVR